jgi:hypothetical protein
MMITGSLNTVSHLGTFVFASWLNLPDVPNQHERRNLLPSSSFEGAKALSLRCSPTLSQVLGVQFPSFLYGQKRIDVSSRRAAGMATNASDGPPGVLAHRTTGFHTGFRTKAVYRWMRMTQDTCSCTSEGRLADEIGVWALVRAHGGHAARRWLTLEVGRGSNLATRFLSCIRGAAHAPRAAGGEF